MQMFNIKILLLWLTVNSGIIIVTHLWAHAESGIYNPHPPLSPICSSAEADSIMMQKGVFEKPGSFLIKPHTHTYL